MSPRPWSPVVQIPSTIAHAIAILATVFRLLYRWHLSRFWWEDGWAVLALVCDVACLVSVWMEQPPHRPHVEPQSNIIANWLLSLALTSVVWFARMSILCSVVRIANPTHKLRRIAYSIGILFLVMEAALVAQKIDICILHSCWLLRSVVIAQLVTDIVADVILVALPIWFLWGVHLPQDRRILVLSAFSASILITVVTICHCILLFRASTNATFVIGHVKAALALFVCNSLVLVTFAYRLCRTARANDDDDRAGTGATDAAIGSTTAEFTSIIDLPSKFSVSHHTNPLSVMDTVGNVTYPETRTLPT